MGDLTTSETCDKCGKTIEILIADFEAAMKDDLPILCSDCQAELLNEQAEDDLPDVFFKYKIEELAKIQDFAVLNKAGSEGWELVAVDNGEAYFKKAYHQEAP